MRKRLLIFVHYNMKISSIISYFPYKISHFPDPNNRVVFIIKILYALSRNVLSFFTN